VAIHLRLLSKSELFKLRLVKVISLPVAILAIAFITGCGFFGTNEQVNQQPRKAVFKAADENEIDNAAATPLPEKVPGEEPRPRR
jgi:hypothetical protein